MVRPHPYEGVARCPTVLEGRQEAHSQAPAEGSHGRVARFGVGRQVELGYVAGTPPSPERKISKRECPGWE